MIFSKECSPVMCRMLLRSTAAPHLSGGTHPVPAFLFCAVQRFVGMLKNIRHIVIMSARNEPYRAGYRQFGMLAKPDSVDRFTHFFAKRFGTFKRSPDDKTKFIAAVPDQRILVVKLFFKNIYKDYFALRIKNYISSNLYEIRKELR